MASTVTLRVKVIKKELDDLEAQIQKIRTTPIEIKTTVPKDIKKFASQLSEVASNLEKVTKNLKTATDAEIKATEAQAKYNNSLARMSKGQADVNNSLSKRTKAEAELNNSLARRTKAENELDVAHERTIQSENRLATAEQRTQQELIKTERQATKTKTAFSNLFSQFTLSNLASSGITRVLSTIRQQFRDALNEMKELDTALTHYRQVTGASAEQASILGSQSYSVGSKYGTSAADYAESVATYARAGYKETADQLAELSLKTTIVGQTTQEIADQFLLTMDAAYKYGGSVKDLSRVLDGASAIDSTYATTIEKIAAGLGLVAPLAEQVHVSEKELTAAIGTITATTQRSGAESARALRSLFLNIIGDTTTEIEDGVTATEESVASMQYLLEKYAKSAVDAAKATGQVINPMEAIGALYESMQDGLLTEQQLMDLLSGIGGKLRISQLVALVSNWDMYNDMIKTYETSMGSADAKTEVYLESWEAKANVLKNTWTEFVANSLSTDMFKGILDGFTKVLKSVGSLGTALKALGGIIGGIKLLSLASNMAKAAQQFRHLGAEAALAGNKMQAMQYDQQASAKSLTSSILGWSGIAIAGATAAITAYNSYRENQKQAALEQANTSESLAQAELEEFRNVEKLYNKYFTLNSLLDQGKISSEQYETAVRQIAEALGIEEEALDKVTAALQRKSTEEAMQAINDAQRTASALETAFIEEQKKAKPIWEMDTLSAYWVGATPNIGTDSTLWRTEEERIEDSIKLYRHYMEVVEEYNDKKAHGYTNPGDADEFREAEKIVQRYSSTLGKIIEQYDTIEELKEFIARAAKGEFESEDEEKLAEELTNMANGADEAANGADNAAESYRGLSKAIHEAEEALTDYQTATKAEKSDDYTQYAEAWKKAYEDIQKGFQGSNAVNAAMDLFFTPKQIVEMRKKGINAAEVIGSDFWKSIFTYVDENGVEQFISGQDAGSTLAYKLYDDFVNGAEKLGEAIEFNYDETNGLSVAVKSFEELADAMKEVYGVDVDPDFLAVWLEALGMYSSESQETAEGIKEIADGLGAIQAMSGKIDLTKLFSGKIDEGGMTTNELWNLYERILELNESGDIELSVSGEELEAAKEQVEAMIASREELEGQDPLLKLDVDDADAVKKFNILEGLKTKYEEPSTVDLLADISEFNIGVFSARTAIQGLIDYANEHPIVIRTKKESATESTATTSADGQKNFKGGLSLINEEAPELIVENGTARIAGNGQPTLTYLAQGADVYTAQETKAILGGSYPPELFDGINAYAGGTANAIQRWSPTGTTDNGTATTTDDTYNAGTTTDTTSTSSKSNEKDPQLEALKEVVDLRKSELSLLNSINDVEKNIDIEDRVNAERAIQSALLAQIDYLESIGGSQEDINKLYEEWWKVEGDIEKLIEDGAKVYEDRRSLLKSEYDLLEAQGAGVTALSAKNKEIRDVIQEQIDYLEKNGGSQEEINKLKKEQLDIDKEIAELEEEQQEKQIERYETMVSMRKSQLSLAEANGSSINKQIRLNQRISASLGKEIAYLQKIGGHQEDILKLKTEQAEVEEDIAKLQEKKIQNKLDKIENDIEFKQSELALLEERDASADKRIAKMREIDKGLVSEIKYLRKVGGHEKEIVELQTERAKIRKEIAEATKEEEEKEQERLEKRKQKYSDIVELRKSQLSLLEAQDANISKQIKKEQQIVKALGNQAAYLKSINADEKEINAVLVDQLTHEKNIESLREKRQQNHIANFEKNISLRQSELDILEESDASISQQIKKRQAIGRQLEKEIKYLKSIGADQETINKVILESIKNENEIAKLREGREEKQKQKIDEKKKEYESIIALRKSELSLLEAQDAPVKDRILKQREIQKAIQQEIKYLEKVGGSQEEINKLKADELKVTEDIVKLNKSLYDDLTSAINEEISNLNKQRDEELKVIKDQIDALKEKKSVEDKEKQLQDKLLAVEKARAELAKAQAERNVRYYNAKTGQWEWRADANAVKSAKDELDNAKKALADLQSERKREDEIARLEARQQEITDKYLAKTEQWQKVLDELKDPVISIADALKNIENNATKGQKETIEGLNVLLKPLGYSISTKKLYDSGGVLSGLGGIKATRDDEMILPPDITSKMLMPQATSMFNQRLRELGYLYSGTPTMLGSTSNSIGSQYNGNIYKYGNITLTEGQARSTTVYDLAQMARGLRAYNNAI